MLQRKQSLFLAVSVILFVITYYFPFGKFADAEMQSYHLVVAGNELPSVSTYYFAVPLSIAATLTLISIFLYGNRQRQMMLVRLTFIFFAVSFALLALYTMDAQKQFSGFSFGLSFFLPFISFFLNMLALRAIRSDEKLVRSVDRIR